MLRKTRLLSLSLIPRSLRVSACTLKVFRDGIRFIIATAVACARGHDIEGTFVAEEIRSRGGRRRDK